MMDKIEFRYTKFSYGMDDYAVPVVEVFICACSSVCRVKRMYRSKRKRRICRKVSKDVGGMCHFRGVACI